MTTKTGESKKVYIVAKTVVTCMSYTLVELGKESKIPLCITLRTSLYIFRSQVDSC